MPKLAHSLNRPVSVAIPAFFGDDAPRRCTLIDIELGGLWFGGDAVNNQLEKLEDTTMPDHALATVFFPYDQIVYVFDPAQFAYLARELGSRARSTEVEDPRKEKLGVRHHDSRPKQKESKRKR